MTGRGEAAEGAHQHAARDQQAGQSPRPKLQRRAVERRSERTAPPRARDSATEPEQTKRDQRTDAPLEKPFSDERTANERDRRADELHDFKFIAARMQAKPDD